VNGFRDVLVGQIEDLSRITAGIVRVARMYATNREKEKLSLKNQPVVPASRGRDSELGV